MALLFIFVTLQASCGCNGQDPILAYPFRGCTPKSFVLSFLFPPSFFRICGLSSDLKIQEFYEDFMEIKKSAKARETFKGNESRLT